MVTRLRRLLLSAFVAGTAGTLAELFLLGHVEDWQQLIPVVLLSAALPAIGWHVLKPGPAAVLALQLLLATFIFSGAVGVVLHFQGNVEFELEMYPELAGMELWRQTLTGATPVLAPGTMVLLGLVGFAYTYVSTHLSSHTTRLENIG